MFSSYRKVMRGIAFFAASSIHPSSSNPSLDGGQLSFDHVITVVRIGTRFSCLHGVVHILRVVNGYFLDFQCGNHVGKKMI